MNSNMDGKTQAWRDAADKLLEALARENKFIVGDMLIIFLESAGYGLDNYMPLGGVFKRAAKRGIIKKVHKARKQALWASNIYNTPANTGYRKMSLDTMRQDIPELYEGKEIYLQGFDKADGKYRIVTVNENDNTVSLEAVI